MITLTLTENYAPTKVPFLTKTSFAKFLIILLKKAQTKKMMMMMMMMLDVVEMRKPLMEEVKSAIEMLEKFSPYSDFGEDVLESTRLVSHFIARKEQSKRKQANITDFFKIID